MDNNFFGERLLSLRKTRGESQQKVADDVGIHRQTLNYYEKGKRCPDVVTLERLARHFEVSADYLLGISDAATDDTDLRKVCDYTGLSAEAAKRICKDAYPNEELFKTLNAILNNESFFDLVKIATEYEKKNVERGKRIKKYLEHSVPNFKKGSPITVFSDYLMSKLKKSDREFLKEIIEKNYSNQYILNHIYDCVTEINAVLDSSFLDLQTFRAQRSIEMMLQTLFEEDKTSLSYQVKEYTRYIDNAALLVAFRLLDEKVFEQAQEQDQEEGAEE